MKTLIYPIPEGVEVPDFNKRDNVEAVYRYYLAGGQLAFVVVRYTPKSFKPWTYHIDGWICKGLPDWVPSPLYNLPEVYLYPHRPILIVEGEKTCNRAIELFTDFVCVTFQGGANRVAKSDLSPLYGRDIIVWPDNDRAGETALRSLVAILRPKVKSIVRARTIDEMPEKWDVGDIEDGDEVPAFDYEEIPVLREEYPYLSSKGGILNCIENLEFLLQVEGIVFRRNIMNRHWESNSRYTHDALIGEIESKCAIHGVSAIRVKSFLRTIAEKKSFHPAVDWIESIPWDGLDRIPSFLSTVVAENQDLSNKLIYRWMLGACAAAFSTKGISLPGVLTFQGKQGVGKTEWFKRLCPSNLSKVSVILNPNDKDSLIGATSSWLIELGEVDRTFDKSSAASLKAFLTSDKDVVRMPYGTFEEIYPRRTSYFASVNSQAYLIDETGNRRWWSINTISIDYHHDVDMQQVWAQFFVLIQKGESIYPTKEELDLTEKENELFETPDPIEELILIRFNHLEKVKHRRMTSTQILQEIGIQTTNYNCKKANRVLKKFFGDPVKIHGLKVYLMPPSR